MIAAAAIGDFEVPRFKFQSAAEKQFIARGRRGISEPKRNGGKDESRAVVHAGQAFVLLISEPANARANAFLRAVSKPYGRRKGVAIIEIGLNERAVGVDRRGKERLIRSPNRLDVIERGAGSQAAAAVSAILLAGVRRLATIGLHPSAALAINGGGLHNDGALRRRLRRL